jgi:hypothetical protein
VIAGKGSSIADSFCPLNDSPFFPSVMRGKFTATTKTSDMKQQIPIKRFEYCTPDGGVTTGARSVPDSRLFGIDFRLMTMDIDFERRTLSLEGISRSGSGQRKKRRLRSGPDGEFIKVFATICPGPGSSLFGTDEDGLVLSLDGVLEDSKTISSCNGLLTLHCAAEKPGWNGGEWCLTVYVYDDYNEQREINLNLTMWPLSENAGLN